MDPLIKTSIAFLVASIILQQLVAWSRRKFPRLDGDYVLGVAIILGLLAAYFTPELRIAETFFGETFPLWLDVLASGIALAAGMSFFADLRKESKKEE